MAEARTPETGRMNARVLSSLSLILFLFVLIYFTTFRELVTLWSTDDDYGHGFLVLPVCIYLLWKKRHEISGSMSPSLWGMSLVVLWAALYTVGTVGYISTFIHLSMLVFIPAGVAVLVGSQAARAIALPMAFMVFMFPIPAEIYNRVTNPLLLISTTVSFHILSLLRVPVLQDGNLLTLPNYTMEVVQACSGIRSMVSIMALAFLMGYLALRASLLRVGFFLLAVPTAILGNVLRISITALLVYHVSPQAAEGFSHTLAGITTFAFSFIVLFGFLETILWFLKKRKALSSPQ